VSHRDSGGTKLRPEARGPKGRGRGGVLEEGRRAPSPPAKGSGEHCQLPSRVRGRAPENLKFSAT